jgi:hypothetical protein
MVIARILPPRSWLSSAIGSGIPNSLRRLSTLPQLPLGLEPMLLAMARFLSSRHPYFVSPCPNCFLRWGCYRQYERIVHGGFGNLILH